MLDALTTPVNERERPIAANKSQICVSPHRFMTPNTPNRPRTSPPPAPHDPCHGRPTTAKTTDRSLTTTAHPDATSQQRTANSPGRPDTRVTNRYLIGTWRAAVTGP